MAQPMYAHYMYIDLTLFDKKPYLESSSATKSSTGCAAPISANIGVKSGIPTNISGAVPAATEAGAFA